MLLAAFLLFAPLERLTEPAAPVLTTHFDCHLDELGTHRSMACRRAARPNAAVTICSADATRRCLAEFASGIESAKEPKKVQAVLLLTDKICSIVAATPYARFMEEPQSEFRNDGRNAEYGID